MRIAANTPIRILGVRSPSTVRHSEVTDDRVKPRRPGRPRVARGAAEVSVRWHRWLAAGHDPLAGSARRRGRITTKMYELNMPTRNYMVGIRRSSPVGPYRQLNLLDLAAGERRQGVARSATVRIRLDVSALYLHTRALGAVGVRKGMYEHGTSISCATDLGVS